MDTARAHTEALIGAHHHSKASLGGHIVSQFSLSDLIPVPLSRGALVEFVTRVAAWSGRARRNRAPITKEMSLLGSTFCGLIIESNSLHWIFTSDGASTDL